MTPLRLACVSTLAAVGLLIVTGCDNDVIVEDGGGGSGGGAGGSTGDGGSGAGDACQGFADEAGQSNVTIRFRNDDAVPIYLPGNCTTVAFSLEHESMPQDVSFPFEGTCLQTCEDLQTQDPFACDACAPLMYRLDPGQELEVRWDGTGLASSMMPGECFFTDPGSADESCNRIVDALAGAYTVEVLGHSDCGEDCLCEDTGECFGFPSGQSASPQPATFSFPDATSIDVVFPPCTFGCPPEPGN